MEDIKMSKTATVRARMDSNLKADVEALLRQSGISTTEAINMFYSQIRLHRGLPFPVDIPNETTMKTFEKTDRGEELISYDSVEEMFDSLDKC